MNQRRYWETQPSETEEEFYAAKVEKLRRQYLEETKPFLEILIRCELLATGFMMVKATGEIVERVYPDGMLETKKQAQWCIDQIKERIFGNGRTL